MVAVAQLVRAPLCGRGGRRFESAQPPQFSILELSLDSKYRMLNTEYCILYLCPISLLKPLSPILKLER